MIKNLTKARLAGVVGGMSAGGRSMKKNIGSVPGPIYIPPDAGIVLPSGVVLWLWPGPGGGGGGPLRPPMLPTGAQHQTGLSGAPQL